MEPTDPESSPSERADFARAGNGPPSSGPLPATMTRILAIAAFAGLLAGVASLIAGEVILKSYQNELVPALQAHPTAEDMRRWRDARIYSAVLTFTTMGGILGLAMGLAGGLARRSASRGRRAAIVGLVLGTAAAASLGLFLVLEFLQEARPAIGRPGAPLAHAWCDLVGRRRDRRPGVRAGARRQGSLERNPGGRARSVRPRRRHLRDRRCARLRVQQDGPPAVSLDREPRRWPNCWSRSCPRPERSWPFANLRRNRPTRRSRADHDPAADRPTRRARAGTGSTRGG